MYNKKIEITDDMVNDFQKSLEKSVLEQKHLKVFPWVAGFILKLLDENEQLCTTLKEQSDELMVLRVKAQKVEVDNV